MTIARRGLKVKVKADAVGLTSIEGSFSNFCPRLRQISNDLKAVFIIRFRNERHSLCDFHPSHLINVAILPCESRNTENAR